MLMIFYPGKKEKKNCVGRGNSPYINLPWSLMNVRMFVVHSSHLLFFCVSTYGSDAALFFFPLSKLSCCSLHERAPSFQVTKIASIVDKFLDSVLSERNIEEVAIKAPAFSFGLERGRCLHYER